MISIGWKFDWGDVSQRFVRTSRVVFFQPAFRFFPDLAQVHEAPGIRHIVAVDTVEPLEKCFFLVCEAGCIQ